MPRPRRSAAKTRPATRAADSVLILGARPTETSSIARAFRDQGRVAEVGTSLPEALELLQRRWGHVMLDARWEEPLLAIARECARTVNCFVIDPKRAHGHYQPIPLGQADVAEILGLPKR